MHFLEENGKSMKPTNRRQFLSVGAAAAGVEQDGEVRELGLASRGGSEAPGAQEVVPAAPQGGPCCPGPGRLKIPARPGRCAGRSCRVKPGMRTRNLGEVSGIFRKFLGSAISCSLLRRSAAEAAEARRAQAHRRPGDH